MVNCKACGRDIASDMMFCPYCGTKRTVDQFGKPIEERSERRLGLIAYVSGEGRLGGVWTIIVTDMRLLFCKALPSDDVTNTGPRSPGLSMMTRRDADSGCGVTYALRYHEMTLEEAMAEGPENFEVQIKDVVSALLGQRDERRYSVVMVTPSETLEFSMPLQHDHRDLLMTALGQRIRW